MNESFFGQYSVFAVFGSVVGCVVVPLIAQSMECMILSAIVLSLTAAHLNKKGVNEKDCSKILLTKELEKKKLNHNNNNTKKHKHHTPHSQHTHNNSSHQYLQHEQEYMQQHEHLKVVEMEKRTEEKRLKKLRKREERLKKREEENKKQKELEERYRTLKDKRVKQKENLYRTTPNNSYYNSSVSCLEKYCHTNDGCDKRQHYGLSTVDESKPRKQCSYISNNQRIPRFERNRTASMESTPTSSNHSQHNANRSITGSLTIGCSSLSASCSSLSSISSSGSSSPPLPTSPPPCNNGAWKPSPFNNLETSPNKVQPVSPQSPSWTQTNTTVISPPCQQLGERGLKSYSNGSQTKSKLSSLGFDSSSLFCSQDQTKNHHPQSGQAGLFSGEYSLFGPQKFTNNLPKSTVM